MADDGIETRGTLVRIPEVKLGSLNVTDVGALDGALRAFGASPEEVLAAMHGKRGDAVSLILERDNKQIRLETRVAEF